MILFTLLAGSPPFWHRKQMLMLRMIMEGRYQFGSPEWDDRSDTVKDLVRTHVRLHRNYQVNDVVENECPCILLCFADIQATRGGSSCSFDCRAGPSTSLLQGVPEREHSTLQSQEDVQGEVDRFCYFYWQLISLKFWSFNSTPIVEIYILNGQKLCK